MAGTPPTKMHVIAGIFALCTTFYFLLPLKFFIISTIGVFLATSVVYIIYQGWESAEPNEWLLIIENGVMKQAGVGLKVFRNFNQTAVRFPSTINRITFQAQQSSKEMYGLEVSGFAIWAVNREKDGPFKCYKYMQGGSADENVKQMCESIVRH